MNIVVAPSYFGLKQTVTKKTKNIPATTIKLKANLEEELVDVSRTDSVLLVI